MKNYTKEELEGIYLDRKMKLVEFMSNKKIDAAVFEDTEGRRNPAVRYFTGHPSDALYVIAVVEGKATDFLVPWDENLAKEKVLLHDSK